MTRKFWFWILGVAVLSLIFANPAAAKLAGKSVNLGGLFGVSGVCAEWGMNGKIGTEIAMEEINASGGIGGLPIELVWYDDECKGAPAIPLLEKLAKQDQVLVVNGPCQSSTVEVMFPKLERTGLVLVSFFSSKPGLSAMGKGWGFRNTLTSDKQLEQKTRGGFFFGSDPSYGGDLTGRNQRDPSYSYFDNARYLTLSKLFGRGFVPVHCP